MMTSQLKHRMCPNFPKRARAFSTTGLSSEVWPLNAFPYVWRVLKNVALSFQVLFTFEDSRSLTSSLSF